MVMVSLTIQFWDTAGQDRLRTVMSIYYKDSQAAMIVYDVTSQESIKNLEEWIKEYENNNPCEFIISIVGNKVIIHQFIKLVGYKI